MLQMYIYSKINILSLFLSLGFFKKWHEKIPLFFLTPLGQTTLIGFFFSPSAVEALELELLTFRLQQSVRKVSLNHIWNLFNFKGEYMVHNIVGWNVIKLKITLCEV